MAKTKISEFSATPGNNTDIDGINIAEGCAPSGINDAIRELMSQLKDFQAGTAGDSFNGPVGTTTAAAGAFTTLSASSTVSGTGFSNYLASPPAIGGTAAAAGSFTTLTTSSTVTHNGGTANGVAYLNGSKVLTTGSALTFDGTNLGVGQATPTVKLQVDTASASGDLVGWFRQSTFPVAGIRSGSGYAGFGQSAASSETRIYADGATSFITNYLGGSEQMRLTSTGLGIGTSSPLVKVHAYSGTTMGQITADGVGAIRTGVNFANGGTTYGQIYFDNNAPYDMSVMQQYSTGSLRFGTNNTERMRLDSSGNLGLGVTPSAWRSTFKAMEIGRVGNSIFGGVSGSSLECTSNVYLDTTSTYRYANNGAATDYYQQGGNHIWYTAPSGTAGNAISFTQAMTLDASGNFSVGTTSLPGRLNVYEVNNLGSVQLYLENGGTSDVGIRIRRSGADTGFIGNGSYCVTGGGSTNFGIQAVNNLLFATGGSTERARIDSSGNFIQSAPTTPPSLATNGTMVFNLTSNTNLRISVRGSDGVTRTANITLA